MRNFVSKNVFYTLVGTGLSLFASNAFAAGSAGCGLGSLIFKDNVWWAQVLAATTNGTSGNQTFGITTGTSNCAPGLFGQEQKQKDFVAANLSSLEREVAQGSGDSVNGLASVLGCPASLYGDFGSYAQSKYDSIFNSKEPSAVVVNVKSEIQKNPALSHSCEFSSI